MQLPESSRTQLTKLAEASQREVGAGLGLRLSWLPQFPEQMQMSVPSAQGDLVRALEATAFILPLGTLRSGGDTDEVSLRMSHFYDKLNKVHFNFRFLHPQVSREGSHWAPVNTCGAEIQATVKPPPPHRTLVPGLT